MRILFITLLILAGTSGFARQSDRNYNTGIGLRYRFGSAFNNIVNPRFTNGRY
jgi:hypothetical protein